MDLLTALEILELPKNYNPKMLKKNYHSMARKYHPDKNKESDSNEKFLKISEAYEFLNRPIAQPKIDLNFIFKSFPFNLNLSKKEIFIDITVKEYFTGTTKSIKIKENCKCEKCLCINCVGSGFNLNGNFKLLSTCMECLGDGFIQKCNGTCTQTIDIIIKPTLMEFIHPQIGKIKLKLPKPYYLYNGKLFCKFNINLKESLTGFNKIFKDPFDNLHKININKLIQTNDGYKLNLIDITLVFNVKFPEKLSQSVIAQLKSIDF
jgi:hypothetical protein